ncbi:hypothetical protein MWU49_12940 [Alcanivorax sp. S6407]|uniref:hypothetical protein n=1 Tax=Alcanivorax sp. S6407 TaxID=2926424 RepID=UPI001FF55C13|nr:hypothetical protein [Alcanivorax sp. S6407]MCK0154618.1 hypothetical protein [Alcanivorax sp. S6407]
MPKDQIQPKPSYHGKRYKVVHCEGALDSFYDALKKVKANKAKSLTTQMALQIKRLADGGEMSNENFPSEGQLPSCPGQQRRKKFRALKRIPIRGYCWLSDRVPGTWFISHYVYKDYNDLDERDTDKVGRNWRRIEENGDDR